MEFSQLFRELQESSASEEDGSFMHTIMNRCTKIMESKKKTLDAENISNKSKQFFLISSFRVKESVAIAKKIIIMCNEFIEKKVSDPTQVYKIAAEALKIVSDAKNEKAITLSQYANDFRYFVECNEAQISLADDSMLFAIPGAASFIPSDILQEINEDRDDSIERINRRKSDVDEIEAKAEHSRQDSIKAKKAADDAATKADKCTVSTETITKEESLIKTLFGVLNSCKSIYDKMNANEEIEFIMYEVNDRCEKEKENTTQEGFIKFREIVREIAELYARLVVTRKEVHNAWVAYINDMSNPKIITFFPDLQKDARKKAKEVLDAVDHIKNMATITQASYEKLLQKSGW